MPKNLVLHDGVLAEKIVTESHQPIELAQLEAEVATHQGNVDSLASQIEALTTQHTDAQAALEDSKSNLSLGQSLVEVPAESGAEESAEVGTDESAENPVEIPVNVL